LRLEAVGFNFLLVVLGNVGNHTIDVLWSSDQNSKTRSSSSDVGLALSRGVTRDMGEGVVDGDAVDPVLDWTGLDGQRTQPTVDLDTLSMGMSDDFRVAIEEGATSVRIGRAIFGHLA
jgi:hypothetical protein